MRSVPLVDSSQHRLGICRKLQRARTATVCSLPDLPPGGTPYCVPDLARVSSLPDRRWLACPAGHSSGADHDVIAGRIPVGVDFVVPGSDRGRSGENFLRVRFQTTNEAWPVKVFREGRCLFAESSPRALASGRSATRPVAKHPWRARHVGCSRTHQHFRNHCLCHLLG